VSDANGLEHEFEVEIAVQTFHETQNTGILLIVKT
jgi:hypothetical protein